MDGGGGEDGRRREREGGGWGRGEGELIDGRVLTQVVRTPVDWGCVCVCAVYPSEMLTLLNNYI